MAMARPVWRVLTVADAAEQLGISLIGLDRPGLAIGIGWWTGLVPDQTMFALLSTTPIGRSVRRAGEPTGRQRRRGSDIRFGPLSRCYCPDRSNFGGYCCSRKLRRRSAYARRSSGVVSRISDLGVR